MWRFSCVSCAVYLDLLLIKHAQPLQVDHIGQALSEGQAMRPDLLVQSVVSHQVDVSYPVCGGYRNVFSSHLQFNHLDKKKKKSQGINKVLIQSITHYFNVFALFVCDLF